MAAGTVRTTMTTTVLSPYGQMAMPVEYSEAVDEVYPPFTIEVADGASDTSLLSAGAAGLTTIQSLFILSTEAITLKLGVAGSNVAFALAAKAPLRLCGTSLTAASVSNASGSTALVTVMMGGT